MAGNRLMPLQTPFVFDMAKVEAANKTLAEYKEACDKHKAASIIACSTDSQGKGCGNMQAVKDTVYIQSYWYREPYGCTGGDYWSAGEGRFICNACNKVTRLYDCDEIVKLKPYFKEIKEAHDK